MRKVWPGSTGTVQPVTDQLGFPGRRSQMSGLYGQGTSLWRAEHDLSDLRRLTSCGRVMPFTRMTVLDDDGQPVPDGTPGELCIQGPSVMQGYWKQPELTASTLAGGWLHTGDIGARDEDGFFYIVDRKKDMIISGGFNVFPREVEDVLADHHALSAVAVIGVPDEKWGEAVKALAVLRPGAQVDPAELIELVKRSEEHTSELQSLRHLVCR